MWLSPFRRRLIDSNTPVGSATPDETEAINHEPNLPHLHYEDRSVVKTAVRDGELYRIVE